MISFLLIFTLGCAAPGESDTASGLWQEVEFFDEEVSADGKAVTRTYTISNPTSGGCSNALRLTATGTSLTAVTPSGCWVDYYGPAPSFDSLTSSGTSSLSDTWYIRSNTFDKDYSSATYQAWCGSSNPVSVRVTGNSVSRLQYWFSDDSQCIW